MSRRKGQRVKIEPHGENYTFRARVDVKGQEKRVFRRIIVSPIAPVAPGWLNASECHRKAVKMMAALEGRNEAVVEGEGQGGFGDTFEPVKPPVLEPAKPHVPTFAEQAKIFMVEIQASDPADGTQELRKMQLDNWLLPVLGDMPLDQITNSTVKDLVSWMKGGPRPQKGSNNAQRH